MKHEFVLIDEAGQATEPLCIHVLLAVNNDLGRLVLCGDPNQLPPTVKSQGAKSEGLDRSLLERLVRDVVFDDAYIMPEEQYRIVPAICAWPSLFYYEGLLTTAASAYGMQQRAVSAEDPLLFSTSSVKNVRCAL